MFHREPIPTGNQLTFQPDYRLRHGLAVGIGLTTIAALFYLNFAGLDSFTFESPLKVILLATDILGPFVLAGCLHTLRGRHLMLDRGTNKILLAESFGSRIGAWRVEGPFDPAGELNFEYCKAELQSLCMVSYRTDAQAPWKLLVIYTNWEDAHRAAVSLQSWEPRLKVEEFQDPTALPEARGLKPLVH